MASYRLNSVPKSLRILMRTLHSFSHNDCVGMARIVRPHLDYGTRAVQAAMSLLGTNCMQAEFRFDFSIIELTKALCKIHSSSLHFLKKAFCESILQATISGAVIQRYMETAQ